MRVLRIAIVEDNKETQLQLQSMIEKYGEENDRRFAITVFSTGIELLSDYAPQYDLILMDIDMPMLNGMETAKLLRKIDPDVALAFVTNLGKYAIFGYDVSAIGFILKPLTYATFSGKFRRILSAIKEESEPYLLVTTKTGAVKINLADVQYISVNGRYVLLHMENQTLDMRKSMKELESELSQHDFVRCDNSYMVNLKYVSAIHADSASVGSAEVPCSRKGRKVLLDAFTLYLR